MMSWTWNDALVGAPAVSASTAEPPCSRARRRVLVAGLSCSGLGILTTWSACLCALGHAPPPRGLGSLTRSTVAPPRPALLLLLRLARATALGVPLEFVSIAASVGAVAVGGEAQPTRSAPAGPLLECTWSGPGELNAIARLLPPSPPRARVGRALAPSGDWAWESNLGA